MLEDDDKTTARAALEDAVWQALEAGMARAEIVEEVQYALDTAAD